MNQKRSAAAKSKRMIPILVVGIVAALGIGIYIGRQGVQPEPGEPVTGGGAPPQEKGLSALDVAAAKDVPAVLEDPSGNYELVAVVEGVEQNRKLTQNLQVIGAQRQRIVALSQQYEGLPAEAEAQRELLGIEINQLRATLEQNLAFMAKSYGYSLQFNYRLVPHAATMLLVGKDAEGKTTTAVAHEFKDETSYQNFQSLREEYLLQSVAEAKQQAATPAVEGAEPGVISDEPVGDGTPAAPDFEPSAELKAMASDLVSLFNYDPRKNYQINLEKTALYARPATRQ